MNAQNLPKKAATLADIPAKRKRGRPRKDENVAKRERPQLPITPASDTIRNFQHVKVNPSITTIDNNMVGQMVSGVIEGTFDAGYFVAVRAGQSSMILRGVVFQPGCIVPITPANDIAPQTKIFQRGEFRLPVPNPQTPANCPIPQPVQSIKQPAQLVTHSVAPMAAHQVSNFGQQHLRPALVTVPPIVMQKRDTSTSLGGQIAIQENLRMVEQDDVMQVFEVSKPSDGTEIDSGAAKNAKEAINQVSQIQNQALESEIGPSKLVDNQVKSLDHGFQQVPSVTISRSPSPESQNLEFGIKPGGLVHNDLNCMNLGPHHAPTVSEPRTRELVHNELKSPNLRPNEALLDVTPQSVESGPRPNELVQYELKSVNLEALPLEASVPMDTTMENPMSLENNKQTESEVNAITKDGTSYNEKPGMDDGDDIAKTSPPELAVEESAFHGRSETQASNFVAQTSGVDLFTEDATIQPTLHYCPPSNVSESGN